MMTDGDVYFEIPFLYIRPYSGSEKILQNSFANVRDSKMLKLKNVLCVLSSFAEFNIKWTTLLLQYT